MSTSIPPHVQGYVVESLQKTVLETVNVTTQMRSYFTSSERAIRRWSTRPIIACQANRHVTPESRAPGISWCVIHWQKTAVSVVRYITASWLRSVAVAADDSTKTCWRAALTSPDRTGECGAGHVSKNADISRAQDTFHTTKYQSQPLAALAVADGTKSDISKGGIPEHRLNPVGPSSRDQFQPARRHARSSYIR